MNWFQERAQEIKLKEIESLNKEIAERETAYFEEVKNAGYDNTHDYEAMVMRKTVILVFFILLFAFVVLVWWLV